MYVQLNQPSTQQHSLLLDVGNTSIKYAWYNASPDSSQSIADLQVMRTTLESLPELLAEAANCYFCSVRANDTTHKILSLCEQQNISVQQLNTPQQQFGITNAYHTPINMGTDRWMAIIAGGALSERNYIVVDAGTAITCDFVVNHKHIGGWIAPGLHLAREAVVKNTSRVFDDQALPSKLITGIDTPQCVALGALAQLTGMLLQAKTIMYKHHPYFDVFISGGDAATIIYASDNLGTTPSSKNQHLDPLSAKKQQTSELNKKAKLIFPSMLGTTNFIENLVLVGLARVAHENASTNG